MPEEVIYKIYKFYQESQAPYKSLGNAISRFTTREPKEDDNLFKISIKRDYIAKYMQILKERDSNDWRGLSDEIMRYYFDNHQK